MQIKNKSHTKSQYQVAENVKNINYITGKSENTTKSPWIAAGNNLCIILLNWVISSTLKRKKKFLF